MLILGISPQHDSGAVLIEDGRVLAAVNEERLSRRKFHTGFPALSVREVLTLAGKRPEQIDRVAYSSFLSVTEATWQWEVRKPWSVRLTQNLPSEIVMLLSRLGVGGFVFGSTGRVECLVKLLHGLRKGSMRRRIKKDLAELGITAPFEILDHHEGHLWSSWYSSGWDECLAVSLDAHGDGLCSRAALCDNEKGLLPFHAVPFYHSPAHYYAYATMHFGFKCGREGKTTGLAAYGDSSKTAPFFNSRIGYCAKKKRFNNTGMYVYPEMDYLKRALAPYSREDIAAGVQKNLEDVVLAYIQDVIALAREKAEAEKTRWTGGAQKPGGPLRLALSGGVFANVKLNQFISELEDVSEVHIHPHMGDGGLAMGSAVAKVHEHDRANFSPSLPKNVYYGSRFTDDAVESAIKAAGKAYEDPGKDLPARVVEAILDDKVVGLYQGAMEYGPRALGNRTILYHCKDKTINDWLNKRLNRTEFMPFAPVVLAEHADEYFINLGPGRKAANYMTITFKVTERCKKEAPAIVHVDDTARPQIITRDQNPLYYNILKEHHRRTGVPVLINTSFNMHEEPILCTPQETLKTFDLKSVDVLVMNRFLLGAKS